MTSIPRLMTSDIYRALESEGPHVSLGIPEQYNTLLFT